MAQLPLAPAAPAAAAPLLLTLELEPEAQAAFERERRQHFPRTLNRVPAHISLFHALPGEELPSIRTTLTREVQRTGPFSLEVADLMKLGRGVAYTLHAPPLTALHAHLRAAWLPWLTRQDQAGFRPHLVIQNKVEPGTARALFDELSRGFRPWRVEAHALLLWWYRGGPWELAERFSLAP